MAANTKRILEDALLELMKEKSLEKISVRDLLDRTAISRQTFYNHFLDKDDLICYFYDHRIAGGYSEDNYDMDFRSSLVQCFEKMKKYGSFMQQACRMEGPNSLKEHVYRHCEEFDLKYHQYLYGSEPMPDALRMATIYHAHASTSMSLSWILSGMHESCESLADLICMMRSTGMEELLKDGEHPGNPYKRT